MLRNDIKSIEFIKSYQMLQKLYDLTKCCQINEMQKKITKCFKTCQMLSYLRIFVNCLKYLKSTKIATR